MIKTITDVVEEVPVKLSSQSFECTKAVCQFFNFGLQKPGHQGLSEEQYQEIEAEYLDAAVILTKSYSDHHDTDHSDLEQLIINSFHILCHTSYINKKPNEAFIYHLATLRYLSKFRSRKFYPEKACIHALLGFAKFKLFNILDSEGEDHYSAIQAQLEECEIEFENRFETDLQILSLPKGSKED